jgi:hypothetical protein
MEYSMSEEISPLSCGKQRRLILTRMIPPQEIVEMTALIQSER